MITGEFDLIRSIRELVGSRQGPPEGITGIGDDCAVYRIYGLFSTDMSLENVRFDFAYCTHHDAGYRSMAANISDIYAMAGRPIMAFVSAGVPPAAQKDEVMKLYDGLIDCAAKHGVFIAGGDTVASRRFILGISIYGETAHPVMRAGAVPGDYIYVTGGTGGSLLGLELLRSGADTGRYPESTARHLRPEPFAPAGQIVSEYSPTAMIDISDGLMADLGHICRESNCGFELNAGDVPVPDEVSRYCMENSLDPLKYALCSGEEYQLLFTSKSGRDTPPAACIGKITSGGEYIIINNKKVPADSAGYDHFKRTD